MHGPAPVLGFLRSGFLLFQLSLLLFLRLLQHQSTETETQHWGLQFSCSVTVVPL